jgi:hypothetical protein
MGEIRKRNIGQGIAILISGMLAGSVILTPAGAHISSFNHLVTKHFFTKKSADARFINLGEEASSAATAKSADTAKSSDTAKSADVATTAGRATNIYAAQVDSSGTMLGSVPPGVTSESLGSAYFRVFFPRPVAGCVISASAGTNDSVVFASHMVIVGPFESNSLTVRTMLHDGSFAARDFAVLMICPV